MVLLVGAEIEEVIAVVGVAAGAHPGRNRKTTAGRNGASGKHQRRIGYGHIIVSAFVLRQSSITIGDGMEAVAGAVLAVAFELEGTPERRFIAYGSLNDIGCHRAVERFVDRHDLVFIASPGEHRIVDDFRGSQIAGYCVEIVAVVRAEKYIACGIGHGIPAHRYSGVAGKSRHVGGCCGSRGGKRRGSVADGYKPEKLGIVGGIEGSLNHAV